MQKNKKLFKFFLPVLLILIAFLTIYRFYKQRGQQGENPFEYDVSQYKQVDPALVRYDETQQISVQMKELLGIAVSNNDNIFVVGDSLLMIFNRDGKMIATINIDAAAQCIDIGPDDRIYLGMIDHVEIYDNQGEELTSFASLNKQALITSIVVTEKDVFIADAGNKIVLRYNLQGDIIGRIGEKNVAQEIEGFVIPSPYFDVMIGYEGNLWVVNPGRHKLENYSFEGKLRSSWGESSIHLEGFCGCCNPTHIALLSDGSFVTSEKGLPRVKIYNQMGKFKEVVAAPNQFAEGTLGLDLAVDSENRILVLDPKQRQVRIFIRK